MGSGGRKEGEAWKKKKRGAYLPPVHDVLQSPEEKDALPLRPGDLTGDGGMEKARVQSGSLPHPDSQSLPQLISGSIFPWVPVSAQRNGHPIPMGLKEESKLGFAIKTDICMNNAEGQTIKKPSQPVLEHIIQCFFWKSICLPN